MIGTSVDTRAFSEVPPDRRVRLEPPNPSALVVGDVMEVRRSLHGADVSSTRTSHTEEIPSVDKTLDVVLSICERDARNHPNNPRVNLNLGLALLNRGKRLEGIETLRTVLEQEPTNFVALNALAVALFNEGNLVEAALWYHRILDQYPKSSGASMGLASIALRESNFIDAVNHLERALRANRAQVAPHILLALVKLRLDQPQSAIATLRTALRDNVRSAELHQTLAVAYWIKGDLNRAERAFHAALAVNGHLASAIHGLASLLIQQKRTEESLMLLSSHLEDAPDDAQSRNLISDSYVNAGQYKQARAHLQKLIELYQSRAALDQKEFARISNNIGYCFAMEQRHTEAAESLLTAIKICPSFGPQPYENLSRVYLAVNRVKDALRILDRALTGNIEATGLRILREFCLVKLGRYNEAIEELRNLVAMDEAPSVAYADLGWLLVEWADDPDSAIAVLRRGLDRWSSDPMILNNLAYAHLSRGEATAARMVLALIPSGFDPEPFTMATRGFLHLVEGDIDGGQTFYSEAEKLAARRGERKLPALLRQKRALETGRAYLRIGDTDKALDMFRKGVAIDTKDQPYPFGQQIRKLLDDLQEITKPTP